MLTFFFKCLKKFKHKSWFCVCTLKDLSLSKSKLYTENLFVFTQQNNQCQSNGFPQGFHTSCQLVDKIFSKQDLGTHSQILLSIVKQLSIVPCFLSKLLNIQNKVLLQ